MVSRSRSVIKGVQQAPALRRWIPLKLSFLSLGSSLRKFRLIPVIRVPPKSSSSSSLSAGRLSRPTSPIIVWLRSSDFKPVSAARYGHAHVGDVGAAQHQFAELFIRPQIRRRGIGDGFGGVQRQLLQLLQLLETLDAGIGNVSKGEIQALQTLDLDHALDIVIGSPGARERHLNDVAIRTADHLAAQGFNRVRNIGLRRFGCAGSQTAAMHRDRSSREKTFIWFLKFSAPACVESLFQLMSQAGRAFFRLS